MEVNLWLRVMPLHIVMKAGRPHTTWMKNIRADLSSLDYGYTDAKFASLETDVFEQCYTLVVVHATIGLDWKYNSYTHNVVSKSRICVRKIVTSFCCK